MNKHEQAVTPEDQVYRIGGLLTTMQDKVNGAKSALQTLNETVENTYITAQAQGLEALDSGILQQAVERDRVEAGRLDDYLQQSRTFLSTIRGILDSHPNAESCADLECGDHATCRVTPSDTEPKDKPAFYEVPHCSCDPGYEGDGFLCTLRKMSVNAMFLDDTAYQGAGSSSGASASGSGAGSSSGAASGKTKVGAKIDGVAMAASPSGGLIFVVYRDAETKLAHLRLGRQTLGRVFWPANTTGILLHEKPVLAEALDIQYDDTTHTVYVAFVESSTKAGYVAKTSATNALENLAKLVEPVQKSPKPYGRNQDAKARLLLTRIDPTQTDPNVLVFFGDPENKVGRVALASNPAENNLQFDGNFEFYVGKVTNVNVVPIATAAGKFVVAFHGDVATNAEDTAVLRVGKVDADGNMFFYKPLKVGIIGADLSYHSLALVAENTVALSYYDADDNFNREAVITVNATGNSLQLADPTYPKLIQNPKGSDFRGPALVGTELSVPFVAPGTTPKTLMYFAPLEGQPGLSGSVTRLCGLQADSMATDTCDKIPFAGARPIKIAVGVPVAEGNVFFVYINQAGVAFQELKTVVDMTPGPAEAALA
ncbi:unnamed protein product [Amoebophrya sp. A120]|nr:unnamed protein product [Amoebophrya sp. A120]|eukprot:GSA120T00020224001.1